ncbi:hypothetical protein BRDID11004_08590 [Bradyrhizobium diazoefficiens]|uniref:Uncharacterized protein n=1 Tax=Bradyrhizobium diazoefficiens TaxID=1355477 RepID=A0A810A6Z8_9BRAD|nr:hypothetical protein [Bradyrhizobium diazoefficiens]BBZ98232.1 hypothetical protein F07S3_80650 [Bradyrhizobium diazoefficiens]BCA15917.1 hypothetical protein BDHF08_77640 [Bradyrhizobium diazoefficiens]BCE60329.1 hypothetical protein XF5B_78410 [Bradyrhizobium diazoefficiens]BCE69013.1 hypothetical protein XF6B_78120 [Bradyrhizobium diazoefficiens]
MAEFFTHNAPDAGEEGSISGPPGTSIADKLRRAALLMSMTTQNLWRDPMHTLIPWTRALGTIGPEIATQAANRARRSAGMPALPSQSSDNGIAGQYVGPNDMTAHYLSPGYIPRQDWQNAVRQDPFAGLLGPMQKPAPKQPEPASGF